MTVRANLSYLSSFFVRNALRDEAYKSEDDFKETDKLFADEGGAEEPVETSSTQPKKKKVPSLTKTLLSLFGINFAFAVLCKLLHDGLIFIQPQLLK